MKLNIGCGYDRRSGFINIDKFEFCKPDMVIDIEKGLPFEDNSVDFIFSSHCLEHVRPDRYMFVLEEMYRVSKPGIIWHLKLPFDNPYTRCNDDHYRTYFYDSFGLFKPNNKRQYFSKCVLKRLNSYPKWHRVFYTLFPFLLQELEFKLQVVKSEGEKT